MIRAAVESGCAPYVLLRDPASGELGYLPLEPPILPDSALRFARGRPLPPPPREPAREARP